MKFLCEHCKAKYQIADEKAAGRTVRMKCRKCGNAIEVRGAVGEPSASVRAPVAAPADAPGTSAEAARSPRAPRNLATSLSSAPKPARSPEGGALAGAFNRSVQQKEDDISVALDMRELSASDDWYVAINGVPVGPIRVAELRRKAASGAVGDDSLCWQEGMEEWRPVRAVPELAALVREAAAGGRVSFPAPAPTELRPSVASPPRAAIARPATSGPMVVPGPSPQAPTAARAPRPPAAPAPAAPAAVRSNVVPITSRLATAERLNEEPARVDEPVPPPAPPPAPGIVAADPFASVIVAPSPFATAPAPQIAAFAPSPFVAAPAANPPPAAVVAPVAASAPAPAFTPAIVLAPERKPPPFIAIAMIALAAAFGVTAAIVLLKPAPPPVVLQVPAAPAAPPPTPTTALPSIPAPPPVAAAPAPTESAPEAPAAAPGKASSGAPRSTGATAAKSTPSAPTDPALRDLIAGAAAGSGPSAGPGESSGGGGGAQLTESQVQSVVQSHQVGLRRTCWDRMQTAALTVNESVHIVVGPGGQVTSASASGNEATVGHCIETEVKRWSFPGSGEINIPFHFLRQ